MLVLTLCAGVAVLVWRGEEPRATEALSMPPAVSAHAKLANHDGQARGVSTPAPEFLPDRLFRYEQPADAALLTAALPAPTRQVHYVRVNSGLLTGKRSPFWQPPGEGFLEVLLPGGEVAVAVIESSEMLGPDRFTSRGQLKDRPQSRVLFAWHGGFLHASISDPMLGKFALRVATEEFSQFYRVEAERVLPCGGERRPRMASIEGIVTTSRGPDLSSPAVATSRGSGSSSPGVAAAENPQRAEVHLMMVHSQSVLPTLTGVARRSALQSAFDLAIANVNEIFAASLITAKVKLVHVAETQYDENRSGPSKVQDDALTAIYQEADGKMDEIHALRDQVGADIVCLALQRRDSASSGLSFLLGDLNDPDNSRFAFSVVQYSSVTGTNVVAHELGHVFGCAHDRENAFSGPGAYSYSYGYRFFGADGAQYRDIMAYPPGIELDYYSSPRVLAPRPAGVPMGIPEGRPGEADAARTIELNAFATASYRLQTQAAVSPGALINVATRAFVGVGEDVLIGGFVVRGTQPKPMLIRAAGPALAAFGVAGALADPVLTIYGGGTLLAQNDNWMTPIGASGASPGEIASVASSASAFAFPAGSADAAVLVTLAPGAYTAVVEGARETTGAGLVEAYEVEPGATKIVNLATRGYAGRDGKEMVGGFVVKGAGEATKRVLIRVLGPTLSRAPFNMTGTMTDPELELRNSAGELLLRSDDWSSGAEGGAGPANDFNPLVQLYGEKQIFATGLAPSNRREPCVLVDLPPGSYTVVVRPFEERSANPSQDQPAKPGVGVVEVYEVDP